MSTDHRTAAEAVLAQLPAPGTRIAENPGAIESGIRVASVHATLALADAVDQLRDAYLSRTAP